MTGRLERLGIPWADNMGDWFRRTPATGAPWSAAERERQRRLLRGPFTTVVVTGHTHVPGLVRWNTARDGVDGVVANWGSWTSGIVNPHVVRLRTDRVELLEVVP